LNAEPTYKARRAYKIGINNQCETLSLTIREAYGLRVSEYLMLRICAKDEVAGAKLLEG